MLARLERATTPARGVTTGKAGMQGEVMARTAAVALGW
jgi:hypothetical protein